MTTIERLQVTWPQIGNHIDNLAQQLEGLKFERVVGISRGGLPLGVALSHKFNLPFSVVGVSSYNDLTNEQETLVCDTPDVIFEGWDGPILICDDIADSGKTLQFLLNKIADNPSIVTTTATIYYKESSLIKPDFYVEVTDKWIVFPWESRQNQEE